MMRYVLLVLVCVPLYASERKSVKKEEKKIALKKNENVFDIKLSLLPALANMVTDLTPFIAPEQTPAILSNMTALPNAPKVPEDVLITLNNVQNAIVEKDPHFFIKMNHWARYNRYVTPNEWDSIVSNYLSLDLYKLEECAITAARYENFNLAHVILNAVADKLIKEGNKSAFVVENPDLDMILSQMIISKALLDGVECSITKAPVSPHGQTSIKASQSALLCPTGSKKGFCIVTNQDTTTEAYVFKEAQVLTEKWIHLQSWTSLSGRTIATDTSPDLRYQVSIINSLPYGQPSYLFMVLNAEENKLCTPLPITGIGKDVTIIFEDNDSYDFYLKSGGMIFKSNARKMYDTQGQGALFSEQVTSNAIDDLYIKKYFEKSRGLCRCLEEKQTEKFSTRALHTISYSANFLDELKKIYSKADFVGLATACNHDSYVHSLLMQDAHDSNMYSVARTSFEPDTRIHNLLACMNKLPTNSGTLYANALCVYYLNTNKWSLSAQELEGKMGTAMYNVVDSSMKALVQSTLPSSSVELGMIRAKRTLRYYGSLLKQNIASLSLPFKAAAVIGIIGTIRGLAIIAPIATTIAVPLAVMSGVSLKWMYQRKHSLTAPAAYDQLGSIAVAMLLIPLLYYKLGRVGSTNYYR